MLLLREKHTGSERSGHYFPRYHKSEFIFSFSCVVHHECPEAALCSPELQKALKWDYGSCGSFVPVVPSFLLFRRFLLFLRFWGFPMFLLFLWFMRFLRSNCSCGSGGLDTKDRTSSDICGSYCLMGSKNNCPSVLCAVTRGGVSAPRLRIVHSSSRSESSIIPPPPPPSDWSSLYI